jgi:hypothetical protein
MWLIYALAAFGALALVSLVGIILIATWRRSPPVPYYDGDGFPQYPAKSEPPRRPRR